MPLSCVYRAFDAEDNLLYVGVTKNIKQRYKTHRTKSEWWKNWDRTHLNFYSCRYVAEAAESMVIRCELPEFNLKDIPDDPLSEQQILDEKARFRLIAYSANPCAAVAEVSCFCAGRCYGQQTCELARCTCNNDGDSGICRRRSFSRPIAFKTLDRY